jgi:excisionase family DNA binding protein
MTVGEVAEWMRCSYRSLYRLRRDHGLPYARVDKCTLMYSRKALNLWLDARTVIVTGL